MKAYHNTFESLVLSELITSIVNRNQRMGILLLVGVQTIAYLQVT